MRTVAMVEGRIVADRAIGALPPVCARAGLPLPLVGGSGSLLRAIAFVSRPA